jgi:glutamyl-tRNA synthetase
LKEVLTRWEALPTDDFTPETLQEVVWDYASEVGRGSVLWPTRFALSGRQQSPGPFAIAAAVGREETLSRLEMAVKKLSNEN